MHQERYISEKVAAINANIKMGKNYQIKMLSYPKGSLIAVIISNTKNPILNRKLFFVR